jgi:hypothetical protein
VERGKEEGIIELADVDSSGLGHRLEQFDQGIVDDRPSLLPNDARMELFECSHHLFVVSINNEDLIMRALKSRLIVWLSSSTTVRSA